MNRDDLERELRQLCVAHQQPTSPFDKGCTYCDGRMAKIMAVVDEYIESTMLSIPKRPRGAYWSSRQVAEFVGLKSPDHARTWCSRNHIEATYIPPQRGKGGQKQARYPAVHVLEVARKKGLL